MRIETSLRRAAGRLPTTGSEESALRTAARAEREGLVDVAYAVTGSPVGDLVVAATTRGLVGLFYRELDDVLVELAERLSPRVIESRSRLQGPLRDLDEYFAGRRRAFRSSIDWSLCGGFARRVLRAVARIPYGGVQTYGDLAQGIGHPRAARAVGNAVGSNPIGIVVPCHRVVRAGGAIGGYGGGPERKEFLLRLEGAL